MVIEITAEETGHVKISDDDSKEAYELGIKIAALLNGHKAGVTMLALGSVVSAIDEYVEDKTADKRLAAE